MKKIIKHLTYLLVLPFLLCGCNQEDDVCEIFDSGVWNFINYYKNVDWNSNNDRKAVPIYTTPDDLNAICKFTITFDADGTFAGNLLSGGTFKGKWQADPKDRTFAIIGDINCNIKLTGKNAEFINGLKASRFYRGDSRMMLRLAPESKTSCMQFAHRK